MTFKIKSKKVKRFFDRNKINLAYALRSLENIPDGVFWVDEKMDIVYVNKAAYTYLGYSEEELTGMNLMQINGDEKISSVDDFIGLSKLIKNGDLTVFQTYHKHCDSHMIPVEVISASVSIVGHGNYGISIVRDISSRIAFESQLQETNKRLEVLNQELEKSAYTDHLTNVWNRRSLINNLKTELEFWIDADDRISLLILDIDNFKMHNDRYGHLAGDSVLVELAELLKNNIRDTDSITRWGGEEFIIVVPNLDINKAFRYAERLRKLVQDHEFAEVGSLTVSIGVTEFKKDDNIDSWIKRADDALYAAKNYRNQVEFC